jgi:hypothetical protein
MPSYPTKRFTPRQLNALVDDALHGHFVPLGQGLQFEKALFHLANNPSPSQEEIEQVRDMTKYNWRAAAKKQDSNLAPVEFAATHVTQDGTLAALIREGVFLMDGALPLSDIEARLKGIEFEELAEERKFFVTRGMLSAAFEFKHPALAH